MGNAKTHDQPHPSTGNLFVAHYRTNTEMTMQPLSRGKNLLFLLQTQNNTQQKTKLINKCRHRNKVKLKNLKP